MFGIDFGLGIDIHEMRARSLIAPEGNSGPLPGIDHNKSIARSRERTRRRSLRAPKPTEEHRGTR